MSIVVLWSRSTTTQQITPRHVTRRSRAVDTFSRPEPRGSRLSPVHKKQVKHYLAGTRLTDDSRRFEVSDIALTIVT